MELIIQQRRQIILYIYDIGDLWSSNFRIHISSRWLESQDNVWTQNRLLLKSAHCFDQISKYGQKTLNSDEPLPATLMRRRWGSLQSGVERRCSELEIFVLSDSLSIISKSMSVSSDCCGLRDDFSLGLKDIAVSTHLRLICLQQLKLQQSRFGVYIYDTIWRCCWMYESSLFLDSYHTKLYGSSVLGGACAKEMQEF